MGRDKATLPFGPELMLQRIVRVMSSVVDSGRIVVVGAVGQRLPELPSDVAIATDQHPDRGPLEGLAAGLRVAADDIDAVYATSCDCPLLKPEFARFMFDRLGPSEIAVPVDGKFYHPLAAVYRPHVLGIAENLLATDRLRPRFLFEEADTHEVPVSDLKGVDPELSTLANLNHPQDYRDALEAAGFE